METADKPRWHARQLLSIDHLLLLLLAAQIAWFTTQRMGWYDKAFPKGWMELIAVAITLLGLLVLAIVVGVRWLFVLVAWRSGHAMSQFRISTMLLCVAVVSLTMAHVAASYQLSLRQQAAAAALASSGGSVYDSRTDTNLVRPPDWLVKCVGTEFFFDTVGVCARNDAELTHASALTDVQDLQLDGNVLTNTTGAFRFPVPGTEITDDGLAHIRDLSRVKMLWLSSQHITGAGAEHISQLGSLERLELTATQIDDHGLEQLARLHNLRFLLIGGMSDRDGHMWRWLRPIAVNDPAKALRTVQSRQSFRYSMVGFDTKALGMDQDDVSQWGPPCPRSNITDRGLAHLSGLSQLQWLAIEDSDLTGEGLQHLVGMKNLSRLSLQRTHITDDALRHVGAIVRLDALLLDDTPITDQGLPHLRSLPRLGGLILCGTGVDGTGFSGWENSPLQTLDLGRTQVDDTTIGNLRGFTKLNWLELRGTRISDAGLEPLASITSLGVLGLSGTQVTGDGLRHLKDCRVLGRLDLSETSFDEAHLVHLSLLPRLQSLDLSFTPVTDGAIVHLRRFPVLARLNLTGTKVTRSGLAAIQAAMPQCNIDY